MKRSLIAIMIASLLLAGCAQKLSVREGDTIKNYPPYGFLDEDKYKSEKVCYQVSIGNVILSVIFLETLIIPIFILATALYEPVRKKNTPEDKCNIDG